MCFATYYSLSYAFAFESIAYADFLLKKGQEACKYFTVYAHWLTRRPNITNEAGE